MKHRHRWTKPHWVDPMGLVKMCRAKGCPKRQQAVKSPLVSEAQKAASKQRGYDLWVLKNSMSAAKRLGIPAEQGAEFAAKTIRRTSERRKS